MRLKAFLMAAVVFACLGLAGTALAQSGTVNEPKEKSETINQPASSDDHTGTGDDTSVLPFTGADVTLFVVIGVGAIAAGAALVRRNGSKRAS